MSDEITQPDTLKAILVECKAAREAADRAYAEAAAARTAAEKAAAEALVKVQEKHDLATLVQTLRWRVEKWELIHLPVRAPWLALVMCTLNTIGIMLLAWKVLR